MAITNYNISNGLTVGAYNVFAGNGDVITSGNITGANVFVSNLLWGNGAAFSGGVSTVGATGQFQYNNNNALGAAALFYYTGNGAIVSNATTTSTSTTSGAVQLMGGMGIAGNLNVGSNISRNNRTVVTNYSGNVAPATPLQGDEWFRGNTGAIYKYIYDNVSNTYNWINYSSALYNANTAATANTLALRDAGGNLTATNFFGTASSAKYADLAEIYTSDKTYEPGTVVVFGGTAEITVTKKTHDTRVAGVISTNPAYLMNSEATGLPVAFTGRVPCKVRGPVTKGDVLVTSAYPEYAERVMDQLYRPGCILGKALSDVADNVFATIEVAVGRF